MKSYDQNIENLNKYLEMYLSRHNNRYGTPLMLSILITNRCNLQCQHCFYHETIENGNSNFELSLEEYEKISKSMSSFMTGIFCGGEPFIREDMAEIIQIFQRNNNMMLADSASNGQLTDRILSQVERILTTSPYLSYSLGISLDGFQCEHDLIRGKGTFEHAISTWKELKKLKEHHKNFELYVCTAINTINELILPDFINWTYQELEPDKISLLKTRQKPRVGEYIKYIDMNKYLNCAKIIEHHVMESDLDKLNRPQTYLLNSINNYIYDGEILGEKQFKCYAGVHGAFIDYNGDVSACEIMKPVGNLREYEYDFDKLWNNSKSARLRTMINNNIACKKCTHEAEGLLPSLYFEPNNIKYSRRMHA